MTDHPAEDRATEEGSGGRDDWVAKHLGEQWQTAGDGIYRYVPDPEPAAPPAHASIDDAFEHLAALTEEFMDAVKQSGEEEPDARDRYGAG
jgi:hypothetical protein